MSDFPKQYNPKIHEGESQALWEEKKIYKPNSEAKSKFYIPIPPPNVT
jgi:valyl-tRNA synthetase